MSLEFPTNPEIGNLYTATNNVIYFYDGTKWVGQTIPPTELDTGLIKIYDNKIENLVTDEDTIISVLGVGSLNVPDLVFKPDNHRIASINTLTTEISVNFKFIELLDFSNTSTDVIVQNTYGSHPEIAAPYAAFRINSEIGVTNTETYIITTGLTVGATLVAVGSNTYSDVIIVDQTFSLGDISPPQAGQPVFLSYNNENTNVLAVISELNSDIYLGTRGNQSKVLIDAILSPAARDVYDLGTPRNRWRDLFLGTGTIYISDKVTNVDTSLQVSNGSLVLSGIREINVPTTSLVISAGINYNKQWTFSENGTTQFPNYLFQAEDGDPGQVLATNGSGNVTWTTPIAATGNANTGDFTFVDTTLAASTNQTIVLQTNSKEWAFDTTSALIFPQGSYIGPKYDDGDSWFVTPTANSGGVASADGQQYVQVNNGIGVSIGTGYPDYAHEWTFGTEMSLGNLTLPAGGDIRDAGSNISVLKTRIGDTYTSGAFQQLTVAHDEGKLITIAGGNSLFRLPQLTADLLGAEFEFYFSDVAGQVYIQAYYTGVRETTDLFRGSIYVGVDNATTGKLHTATAYVADANYLFLGQHHAKAGSYIKFKAIAFDGVGTWLVQGMCVGDTGQTPNSLDHPFQNYYD